MKRVKEKGKWTLFSPSDVEDLHDLYGAAFEKRYEEYETMAEAGEIKLFKTVEAEDLWRKILMSLFETGIRGSLSRISMSARRRITRAWCTAPISAPRFS